MMILQNPTENCTLIAESSLSPDMAAAQKAYELECQRHAALIKSGMDSWTLIKEADGMATAYDIIMRTKGRCVKDAVLKLSMAIDTLHEIGELESIPIIFRAFTALRAGSIKSAISCIDKALCGETRNDWAYEGLGHALEDLRRIAGSAEQ